MPGERAVCKGEEVRAWRKDDRYEKTKYGKRLFMGSLVISAVAVPAQTAVRVQAEARDSRVGGKRNGFSDAF